MRQNKKLDSVRQELFVLVEVVQTGAPLIHVVYAYAV